MRFDTHFKAGRDVSVEYDVIQWDSESSPETFDRTGTRKTLTGTVEKVISESRSVDAHILIDSPEGEYLLFANGDVFQVDETSGALIGISGTIGVVEKETVVA